MSNYSSPGPIYGVVWFFVVAAVFYLLCSLFSWSFSVSEWNLLSRIIKWLGIFIELGIVVDVIRQVFHRS